MTIDEAIRHCEEVAERYETRAKMIDRRKLGSALENPTVCHECAANHRQLAEWLTELKKLREENIALKNHNERLRDCVNSCVRNSELDYAELSEAKRLLKAAVEDFTAIAEVHAAPTPMICPKYGDYMRAIDIRTRKWRYTDETEKLLGGSENG